MRSAYLSTRDGYIHAAQSCKQNIPCFLIINLQEINSLGSIGERRIGPVPSAHMPDGVVQLRLVAHTQGRTHLVRLLRFRIGGSVAPGSRRTKPNRLALEPATPRNRGVIQNNLDKFRIIQHYLDTFRMQVLTASGQTQSCPGPGATVYPRLSMPRRIHGIGHKSGHCWADPS